MMAMIRALASSQASDVRDLLLGNDGAIGVLLPVLCGVCDRNGDPADGNSRGVNVLSRAAASRLRNHPTPPYANAEPSVDACSVLQQMRPSVRWRFCVAAA